MKTLKKLICIICATLLTLVFCSCQISFNSDNTTSVVNGITENKIMTAIVSVYGEVTGTDYKKEGSGVIFYKENADLGKTNYYFLTNNHVAYNATDFKVYDYMGNAYKCSVVKNGGTLSLDSAYDLAVMCFTSTVEYNVLHLSTYGVEVGDKVIALGCPLGQKNAVTLGKVCGKTTTEINGTVEEASNVRFEVIKHDAPIDEGSSGGALVDYEYNLIGINYACSKNDEGAFCYGYTIPARKVIEFLQNCGFSNNAI